MVRIQTDLGTGSGVIFANTADGKASVLTNYHVIEGGAGIDVVVNDSSTWTSSIRGVDVARDLAILEICCGEFTVVPLGNAENLAPGSEILVIGYALGIEGQASVTTGIVSATRYEPDTDRLVIQTDASLNPGNSGGPMLSPAGEIVGIATYKLVGGEGLGFGISEQTIRLHLAYLTSGQALAIPTPVPRLPTPTPVPSRVKLTINQALVTGPLVTLVGGSIKVNPEPDSDGTYPAFAKVELWTYNRGDPGAGGVIYGLTDADLVNENTGVVTLIMDSHRSVNVVFY